MEHWKLLATVALAILFGVWKTVTYADDKIRKVEQIPAIAEAVLQLKANQELDRARMQRMEERQDLAEQKQDAANALILQGINKILEGQN